MLDIHSEKTGDKRERQNQKVQDRQRFYDLVRARGKQGIVSFLERLDRLAVIVEGIPELEIFAADVSKIVMIYFWEKIFSGFFQGIKHLFLRMHCPAKVEYLAAENGNVAYHFFFLATENFFLDLTDFFVDVIELAQGIIVEWFQDRKQQLAAMFAEAAVAGRRIDVASAGDAIERLDQIVMRGDYKIFADHEIDFTADAGLFRGVVDWKMENEVDRIVESVHLGSHGRTLYFLDDHRVEVIFLLYLGNLLRCRRKEVNPCCFAIFDDGLHG